MCWMGRQEAFMLSRLKTGEESREEVDEEPQRNESALYKLQLKGPNTDSQSNDAIWQFPDSTKQLNDIDSMPYRPAD